MENPALSSPPHASVFLPAAMDHSPSHAAREPLSPAIYEELDFASDLPDFSYDTQPLGSPASGLVDYAAPPRRGHSKHFSVDGRSFADSLQTPFSLNPGSRFSFSHSRNVSLDGSQPRPAAGAYGDAPAPFSPSVSNGTLHSLDSMPQLSSSMSNRSLLDSPYSALGPASTPARRRMSTSLSASNIHTTPHRGSISHSPGVKVGKTPLKAHRRTRSRASVEPGSSQLLASIANSKSASNFQQNLTQHHTQHTHLQHGHQHNQSHGHQHSQSQSHGSHGSHGQGQYSQGSQNQGSLSHNQYSGQGQGQGSNVHYQNQNLGSLNLPFRAMHSRTQSANSVYPEMSLAGNPFESSFLSPKLDLSDFDSTPLTTPVEFVQPTRYTSMGGSHPISHNPTFGGSLHEPHSIDRKNSYAPYRPYPALTRNDTLDSIKIEDQDDDAFKQLRKAKSFTSAADPRVSSTSPNESRENSCAIDLLSPDRMGAARASALKSYPASSDLASITKGTSQASPNDTLLSLSGSNSSLGVPTLSTSSRSRNPSFSNLSPHNISYPTASQIKETSTTQEIAKFAESIMKSDMKRPIVIQESAADVHDPKKRHKCPLCLARFQRPEHVKRHMKSHSSERPFSCSVPGCDRRFNRKDNLKAHLKKIHGLSAENITIKAETNDPEAWLK